MIWKNVFKQLCNSEDVWENKVLASSESDKISEDMRTYAKEVGWKKVIIIVKNLNILQTFNK